jgi:hypothetical protein
MMFQLSDHDHTQFSARRRVLYFGIFILFIVACVLPGSVTPTPIVITATSPASTQTPIIVASPTPLDATPIMTFTAQAGATCTVLQDLNLRPGPGTAYNPPITVLEEGTEFTPIGYDPVGVPGGPWVQTQIEGVDQPGWVSAGAQFISCEIEFDSLPVVEVPPPPRGAPPRVGTGAVDGDGIDNFRFSFDYNPDYFVRMYVFRSDDENEIFSADKDGRGITTVEFLVTSLPDDPDFTEYYRRTEMTPGYCIFAGGEPDCNPWTFENGLYRWNPGGAAVEEGNYRLTVIATAEDGEVGNWLIDINIDLP